MVDYRPGRPPGSIDLVGGEVLLVRFGVSMLPFASWS